MSNKARNTSLDAIKGFTIILVMLGHVLVLNKVNDPILYDWIKAVQMPLFMIVSGYLCGRAGKVADRAAKEQISAIKSYTGMLKKRAIGYLLPFFAWTLVFHLDDFTWAIPGYLEQPERGLWFLITLFVLTFMVYTAQFAEALAGKKNYIVGKLAFWAVYGALALLVLLENRAGIPWLGPHLTIMYIPYYMAAYLFGEYESLICKYVKKNACYALAAAGGVFCIALAVTQDLMVMRNFVDYIAQISASFGGCASVIAVFYAMKENKVKKFLSWLGMYTLEIYSIHYHFAKILNNGTLDLKVYSLPWLGFILASFAVMTALTILVIWIAKRFKFTNYVLYGKK